MIDLSTDCVAPEILTQLEASDLYLSNDALSAFVPFIEHHDKVGFVHRWLEITSFDKLDTILTLWSMVSF